MPKKGGRLTPRERLFVDHMARTNDAVYSAEKAGYSAAQQMASHNANNPALQSVIAQTREKLRTTGAQIGVGVLIELASDKKAPPGVRRAAANDLVKHSGVGAAEGEADKPLNELTSAELDALARQLAERRDLILRAASDKARPVIDATPEPADSGVFD